MLFMAPRFFGRECLRFGNGFRVDRVAWVVYINCHIGDPKSMNMPEPPKTLSRRDSLLLCLKLAILGTVAVLFYPVALFLRPRRETASGALEVVAPYQVNQLKPDAAGQWPAPFNFGGKPCLVVLTPEGANRLAAGQPLTPDDVRAFNAVCTHVDCTVKFRPDKGDIFCNCHNGLYDLNGHNVSGPPPRPLETYKVTLRGKSGEEEIVVSRTT